MKAFLLVCLAAAVCAESDPQLLLRQPILPAATTFYRQPLVQVAPQPFLHVKPTVEEKKPVEVEVESYKAVEPVKKVEIQTPVVSYSHPAAVLNYGLPVVQPMVHNIVPKYQAKNGEVEHTVFKREAEAEAEANSHMLVTSYSNGMVYNTAPVTNKLVYNTAPLLAPRVYSTVQHPVVVKQQVVNPLAHVQAKTYRNDFHPFTQTYAAKGQYVADSVGARHVAKREAEADPLLVYSRMGYNYAPMRTVYNTYSTPYVSTPYMYNAWNPTKTVADYRSPLTPGYAAKGQYVADSVGARHIAKREAEADPQFMYHRLGYNYVSPVRTVYNSAFVRPTTVFNTWSPFTTYTGLRYY